MSTGSLGTWLKESERELLPEREAQEDVPPGTYTVMVNAAPVEDAKSGNGIVCKAQLQILEGAHKGRVIFFNINVRNNNEIAEKIGHQALSDMARAVGLPRVPEHTADFLNIPFKVVVGPQKKDPTRMEVKKLMQIGEAPPTAKTAGTGNTKKPWERK